jgi:diguanylate cyclase (GGDEF)-like protein
VTITSKATQQEILAKIKVSGKLPTPKGLALEVINLTQRENTSNDDVIRAISADPVMGIRVIKAANVLISNSARPVVTISDSVAVLGFRALRQLVLSISLIENHQQGSCKNFNYSHFWAHSLLTGIAVRHFTERLADRSRLAAAEEIFTLGLLGEVGRLAMASVYPEEFSEIIQHEATISLEQLYQKERDKFGFHQAELSSAILADMNFPPIFLRLINDYPQPKSSTIAEGSREWKLMNLLHLASMMADVSLADKTESIRLLGQLRSEASFLAIEEKDIVAVAEKCAHDWPEWTRLLNLGSRTIPSFAELFVEVDSKVEEVVAPLLSPVGIEFKMRVLVVDDDRVMRKVLEQILKSVGHQVALAENGVQALQMLEEVRPHLIISDWVMPEMDGIALCRELRARKEIRSVYVILMTAHTAPEKVLEAFEAGADDYVYKPITQKMFLARLSAAQRVVQLQEELANDREQLLRYSAELASANELLLRQALTDALTGLHNRRFAMERLEQEWSLSRRGTRSLSCLMVDIDHFKSINDRYGHQIGDEALKRVATTLQQVARTQDEVCRYGGEEFLVICPDTNLQAAYQCAERLRLSIAAQSIKLPDESELKMTVSVGVAENNPAITSLGGLLNEADKYLYVAKDKGRNCTVAGL